jgi:hypothetical protein
MAIQPPNATIGPRPGSQNLIIEFYPQSAGATSTVFMFACDESGHHEQCVRFIISYSM